MKVPTLISRDFFCPFPQCWCGSGTTLIAAEKTGRIGWLIELDPK